MSERQTALIFGWSLGCLFFALMALNAVTR
jgi:hypothetical protein